MWWYDMDILQWKSCRHIKQKYKKAPCIFSKKLEILIPQFCTNMCWCGRRARFLLFFLLQISMPIQTHFKENFGTCSLSLSLSLSLQAHFGTFSQTQRDLKQKDGKDAELLVLAWETNNPVARHPKSCPKVKNAKRKQPLPLSKTAKSRQSIHLFWSSLSNTQFSSLTLSILLPSREQVEIQERAETWKGGKAYRNQKVRKSQVSEYAAVGSNSLRQPDFCCSDKKTTESLVLSHKSYQKVHNTVCT